MDMHRILGRLKKIFNVSKNEEVCTILGISPQTLSSRLKRNTVPCEAILNVLENTDDDLRGLFYGSATKIRNEYEPNIQFFNDANNTSVDGSLICSSNFENVYIDPKFLPEACKGNIAAFTIHNESMGGTLKIGDIIFIDRDDTKITDGKIHIVNIGESIIIRRVFIMPDFILLKSDNPTFPQIEITLDKIAIMGRVIYKRTSL